VCEERSGSRNGRETQLSGERGGRLAGSVRAKALALRRSPKYWMGQTEKNEEVAMAREGGGGKERG
jgi:hypothetical protein